MPYCGIDPICIIGDAGASLFSYLMQFFMLYVLFVILGLFGVLIFLFFARKEIVQLAKELPIKTALIILGLFFVIAGLVLIAFSPVSGGSTSILGVLSNVVGILAVIAGAKLK